ncbi:hypothetical protein [Tropicimonas sp. IMCC6043]|uniref:hypothetical protein n=1 Tax=Tropicimonas sp. IMCC6043 TaxID=2510645 RepID=UPI00101C5C23|nr:hypothetical protein [Tropicimonas sp. IMCC6043]RYH10994.1 hypothetical protein EU800_07035 [Tropicimonas sp. IMCC6043]
MPNAFAYVMIFAWPVFSLAAFRRLPLPAGISAAILGALLLLPEQPVIDLPMLPAYDKALAGMVAAFLLIRHATTVRGGHRSGAGEAASLSGWLPRETWVRICFLGIFCGSAITVILNDEPLVYGTTVLPGLTYYDVLSALLTQGVLLLPFLIARKYLASPQAQRYLLTAFVIAALIYAFPALWEVRMSPQLNRQIYGFFPHSWIQHIRQGGFRPLVFMNHGLQLSLFLSLAFLGALAWARSASQDRKARLYAIAGFLFVTLVLSKSLGALAVAVLLGPVVVLAPGRMQMLAAAGIAAITLTYPVLRGNQLVPVESVVSFAAQISTDRAGSLEYRLNQEDIMLEKARQKPVFGWGSWGRWRVFDEAGRDITVSDGAWAILFGTGGWVLYLSTFGLFCLPILLLARRALREPPDAVTCALSIMLAANMIDLIPNSGLLSFTWLMAGALTGRLELARVAAPEAAKATPDPVRGTHAGPVPASPFRPPSPGPARAAQDHKGSLFAPRLHSAKGRPGQPRRG